MKTTLARVVVTLAAAVRIVRAGPASVHAAQSTPAPDTLGLTIESKVYADEARTLAMWNTSSVEVGVTLTPTGDWQVTPATLTLAPDERTSVEVSNVGTEDGTVDVVATSTAPTPAGVQRSAISLTAQLFQHRPFDWVPVIVWSIVGAALAALLLGMLVATVTRRRARDRKEREWIEARLHGGTRHAHPIR